MNLTATTQDTAAEHYSHTVPMMAANGKKDPNIHSEP